MFNIFGAVELLVISQIRCKFSKFVALVNEEIEVTIEATCLQKRQVLQKTPQAVI